MQTDSRTGSFCGWRRLKQSIAKQRENLARKQVNKECDVIFNVGCLSNLFELHCCLMISSKRDATKRYEKQMQIEFVRVNNSPMDKKETRDEKQDKEIKFWQPEVVDYWNNKFRMCQFRFLCFLMYASHCSSLFILFNDVAGIMFQFKKCGKNSFPGLLKLKQVLATVA